MPVCQDASRPAKPVIPGPASGAARTTQVQRAHPFAHATVSGILLATARRDAIPSPASRTATIALLGALLSGAGASAASAPAEQLVERQGRQPASASVLSEHHIEALDAMEPQAQAEFLLERAINHYQGANEQIAARAESWRGKITLNKRLNGLFVTALNSDDLRVRAASIELNLAALNLKKSSATVDRLEPDARSGAQGLRANALWRIGLLGNRGVEPDRALQILLGSILDENVNVRYWAVEGLAYLGTDGTIAPLLSVFRDDRRR